MRIRMNREKMAGENFREGRMEVAFELWIEQITLSRLQRKVPPLSGKRYRNYTGKSRIVLSAEIFLNSGGTTDM